MEILASSSVMETTWWSLVALAVVIIGVVATILAAADDYTMVAAIFAIIVIIGIIVLIVTPSEMPTDQMSYIVEITDNTLFHSLINKGYSFTRLFENKEIYVIVGDVLK